MKGEAIRISWSVRGSTLAVWATVIVALASYCHVSDGFRGGSATWLRSFEWALRDWAFWAAITPWLLPLLERYSLKDRQSLRRNLGTLLVLGLALSAASILVQVILLRGSPILDASEALRSLKRSALTYGGLALVWNVAREHIGTPRASVPPPPSPGGLWVIEDGNRVWLPWSEIVRVSASGNYVDIEAAGGTYLERRTLQSLEEALSDPRFLRVHRSHIVNLRRVRRVERASGSGALRARLDSGSHVPVSRRYQAVLSAALTD